MKQGVATVADVWRPTSELERRLVEAVRAGDREAYFRMLAEAELLLPVAPDLVEDVLANRVQPPWPTREDDGRVHVLAFTSAAAMLACLGPGVRHFLTVSFADVAQSWPELRWWLAVDAVPSGAAPLPLEGRLPGWFVRQILDGDALPPQAGRPDVLEPPVPLPRGAHRAPDAPVPVAPPDAPAEPAPQGAHHAAVAPDGPPAEPDPAGLPYAAPAPWTPGRPSVDDGTLDADSFTRPSPDTPGATSNAPGIPPGAAPNVPPGTPGAAHGAPGATSSAPPNIPGAPTDGPPEAPGRPPGATPEVQPGMPGATSNVPPRGTAPSGTYGAPADATLDRPPATPGDAHSTPPGAIPGVAPGAAHSAPPGTTPGGLPGDAHGAPPGTTPGGPPSAPGGAHGTPSDVVPGAVPGGAPSDATLDGLPGTPGDAHGTPPGAIPGAAPGTPPGTPPGSAPGTPPGIPPSSVPGTSPGSVPGGAPGASSDATPGLPPGLGGEQGLHGAPPAEPGAGLPPFSRPEPDADRPGHPVPPLPGEAGDAYASPERGVPPFDPSSGGRVNGVEVPPPGDRPFAESGVPADDADRSSFLRPGADAPRGADDGRPPYAPGDAGDQDTGLPPFAAHGAAGPAAPAPGEAGAEPPSFAPPGSSGEHGVERPSRTPVGEPGAEAPSSGELGVGEHPTSVPGGEPRLSERPGFAPGSDHGTERPGFTPGDEHDTERLGFTPGGEPGTERPGSAPGSEFGIELPGGEHGTERPGFTPGDERDTERLGFTPGGEHGTERPGFTPGGERDTERPGSAPGGEFGTELPGFTPGGEQGAGRVGAHGAGERESERTDGAGGVGEFGAERPGLAPGREGGPGEPGAEPPGGELGEERSGRGTGPDGPQPSFVAAGDAERGVEFAADEDDDPSATTRDPYPVVKARGGRKAGEADVRTEPSPTETQVDLPPVDDESGWEDLRDQHRALPRDRARAPFEPANDVERELLRAASTDDHDLFLQTLAGAEVLLPVPDDMDYTLRPGRPGFPWRTREVDGVTTVPVFTSPERLVEEARRAGTNAEYLTLPFTTVLRYWPDKEWPLAVNAGSPAGGTVHAEQLPGLATWADQRAARRLGESFEPQNEVEERLFEAAGRGDADGFFAILAGAQVLVPAEPQTLWGIAPDDPEFPWRPVPVHGRTAIQVFTSLRWMNEAIGSSRFVMPSFQEMAAAWPDDGWTLVLNPGTPIDAALPAERVRTFGAAPPEAAPDPEPQPLPRTDEPEFEPGNRIDQELYEAVRAGDSDAFLRVLLAANVLVPIPEDAPLEVTPVQREFRWDAALRDPSSVRVFTSMVRLREVLPESRFVYADFRELIAVWPRDDWAMLLNPGTRIGASLEGGQVRSLSEWAARVGLVRPRPEPAVAEPEPAPRPEPRREPEPEPDGEPLPTPAIMQKVVPHGHVGWYLEQGYDRVGGFVHPTSDVAELQTPAQLYETLGLLYADSPFSATDESVYVIRWPAYCSDLYRVPFGGRTDEELAAWGDAGWVVEAPPFQGSGFAPGSAGSIREYKVDSVRLPHGAEMYLVGADRSERFVAMYDPDRLAWLRPEAGEPDGDRR
ncbi:SseB family protein [Actinomadura rayongensis]|uniref:SseB protein N-terminal domain-containing protein n=1 Tax=Actinomadura rayongensis TaxID=1429076 RepID=A0A6I4WB19_9ACTN|nr:SseB family protein [Actinomadura rayongensis]MXQ65970.1 hypothetical protein [Actinomadura rayongensis]